MSDPVVVALRAAIAKDDSPVLRVALGQHLLRSGDAAAALAEFEAALLLDAVSAEALGGAAEAADALGEGARRDAYLLAARAADAEPEAKGNAPKGGTNHPWDVDPAMRRPGRFDRMLFVSPPDAPARRRILQLHLSDRPVAKGLKLDRLAKATDGLSALGRHDEAVAAGDEAVRVAPDHAAVLGIRASVALEKKPEEALEYYERSLAIAPRDAENLNDMGVALARLGRKEEAALAYRSAITVDPTLKVAKRNARATAGKLLGGTFLGGWLAFRGCKGAYVAGKSTLLVASVGPAVAAAFLVGMVFALRRRLVRHPDLSKVAAQGQAPRTLPALRAARARPQGRTPLNPQGPSREDAESLAGRARPLWRTSQKYEGITSCEQHKFVYN